MTNTANPAEKTLADLGITQPERIAALFTEVRERFDEQISQSHDQHSWETFKLHWLARKSGVLTQITDNWLKPAPPELKRAVGASLNVLRAHVESKIAERGAAMESGADDAAIAKERIDLSLPGVTSSAGSRHLIRQVFQEIEDTFVSIGFSAALGPENETPYYNFEALNIP